MSVLLLAVVLHSTAQDGASNIEFTENRGQWDKQVNFKGEMSTGAFFLRKDGFTVLLHHPDDLIRLSEAHHGTQDHAGGGGAGKGGKKPYSASFSSKGTVLPDTGIRDANVPIRSHAYKVSFIGASDAVTIIPDKQLPSYNNYFIGSDSTKWAGNCRVFQGVTYKNIYPNVDIRYYTDKGFLKYDIIVHPGGNVDKIEMKFDGADQLSTKKNQLLINTSVGQVKELVPYSYLFDQKGKTEIGCKYSIRNGNTVKFKVGDYDPNATLIIDPTLVFCSFTGSKQSNWGFTATPGPDGSFFAGGIVFGEAFPYNTGQLQPIYGGGAFDVGIIKFSSNGSNKVYATYIGGSDNETPHSMICDAQGNLVVMGRTYSGNSFPATTHIIGSAGGSITGAKMFVVKLNPSGSARIGSMLIGGSGNDCVNVEDQLRGGHETANSLIRNYGDDSRSEVVLDGAGNICVAGNTQSSDFPIVGNVFQPKFGGGTQDGVVLCINPSCNSIIWSSYLGGTGTDGAFVLKPNFLTGDLFVAGATTSTDFPGDKSNVIQSGNAGGVCDGYVTIIAGNGSTQKKTTYLGTTSADAIYGIQIDKKGIPYVMGTTNGSWPVINVAYKQIGARQFVSKLQPDLSSYIYSTTFGTPSGKAVGMPNISPVAFLVDRCENVYVSGWGGWIRMAGDPYGLSGTQGMPKTSDAIKGFTDNHDFYFIVLKKDITDILYGTFYGQQDNSTSISEHVDGGTSRYDQNGIIYQAICANCGGQSTTPFPTTPGVWSRGNGALPVGGCNLAAVKIAFNFAGVAAGLKVSVNGRDNDTSGCVPMGTVFQDTVRNAKSYIWNFGEPGEADTATTAPTVFHTYATPGRYRVMMVAIDLTACNSRDTTYRTVIARTDRAILDFNFAKIGDCHSLDYGFFNTSTAPLNKPFTGQPFVWDFGDNSAQLPAGFPDPINHNFQSPGTYIVKLMLVDTAYCNYPDTFYQTVRASPLVKAQFITPATGCVPYTAIFNNTSLGGLQFAWNFGDPNSGAANTSTDPSPQHLYSTPGTYTISLVATDPTTCNKVSDTSITILVSARPTAAFTFGPSPPVANTPMVFTNGSTGGVRYAWDFGDVDTLITTSMDTVMHLYNSTDTFLVCLVTFNEYNCSDTVCHRVPVLINPLLDVPNAFTPGRFGQNGIVKVMGFGITKMIWKIYNRWGQQIYQSDNPNVGWDGTYGGVLQPLGVYVYTLEADFSNGKHVTKKGDITLLR